MCFSSDVENCKGCADGTFSQLDVGTAHSVSISGLCAACRTAPVPVGEWGTAAALTG